VNTAPSAPVRNSRMVGLVRAVLAHRRLPLGVAVLAAALVLPSLTGGWAGDDHFHRMRLAGPADRPDLQLLKSESPFALFTFFDGDPQRNARLIDVGLAPWWTYPHLKAAFCRPLAGLTHHLDYWLWPNLPSLMHLQSVLWYAALVAAVAVLYRNVMGATVAAGLAALLFAVDDAHGMPAGWLANRNAVIAALLGVLCLVAHDRWRRAGWKPGAAVAPLALVLSLFSSEAGAAVVFYLLAYAAFVDSGKLRGRLASLLPAAGVVVVWRVVYVAMGYGVGGTGLYIDPVLEPMRFAGAIAERGLFLLQLQWAFPSSRMHVYGVVFLVVLVVLLVPLLRRSRSARFWAMGMVLSVVPICGTYPDPRLLIFVGLGAFGLMAELMAAALSAAPWRPATPLWRWPAVAMSVFFIAVHLVLAPVGLAGRAARPFGPKGLMEDAIHAVPLRDAVEQRDVIFVNAPIAHGAYLLTLRAMEGRPVPRHTRVLAPSGAAVRLSRPDAHTLVVRPRGGYLSQIPDRIVRSRAHPMSLGQTVDLTGLTIRVTCLTKDGRPAEVAFRFDVPLDDPSLLWLHWADGRFEPFTPPEVGQTADLPAPNFRL